MLRVTGDRGIPLMDALLALCATQPEMLDGLVEVIPTAGETLRFRDWQLDISEMSLLAAGQPVELTAHEFRIVELMVRRPKKVFTKQQIYEAVWQENCPIEDKTIHVHISNIRAKLRSSGTDSYIQTEWGIGFKLS